MVALLRCVLAALAFAIASSVHAGADIEAIKKRGVLRCGVSEGIAGFSERAASGWSGMNVDFCRAVAAAVLGDPKKVDFVPLRASTRFPALQSKTIDLLMRNTTWTLTREVLLKFQFPAILYFDGQGFLVPKASGVGSVKELNGATICVEKGTTHQSRLPQYFAFQGWTVSMLVVDSASGVAEAFYAGRCGALSSDASQLAGVRSRAPGGAHNFVLLPERISKEPLGPVVRTGDAEWTSLVRWVLFVMVAAEENGITQTTLDASLRRLENTSVGRVVSGKDVRVASALGVRADWARNALAAVGNYGEVYARNLGEKTPLDIDRGHNRLWTQGGLLYAPPID